MGEKATQRHLFSFGKAAVRKMPGFEQRVGLGVERDLAVLEQPQEPAREYRFADRSGEEKRRAVDRFCFAELRDAVSLREHHAVVVDHGDGQAGHVIRAHAVEQLERDVRLVGEANAVAEMMLYGGGILARRCWSPR